MGLGGGCNAIAFFQEPAEPVQGEVLQLPNAFAADFDDNTEVGSNHGAESRGASAVDARSQLLFLCGRDQRHFPKRSLVRCQRIRAGGIDTRQWLSGNFGNNWFLSVGRLRAPLVLSGTRHQLRRHSVRQDGDARRILAALRSRRFGFERGGHGGLGELWSLFAGAESRMLSARGRVQFGRTTLSIT